MPSLRDFMAEIVEAEIVQRREEGYEPREIEHALRDRQLLTIEESRRILQQLDRLRPDPDFPFEEPSDREAIWSSATGEYREFEIDEARLEDKIHGAWLGRCAGCLLGKPVEGWMKEEIEDYLRGESAYPLGDYFPQPTRHHGKLPGQAGLAGRICGMPRDDDIDYTIIGLHVLEACGQDFDSQDVADAWLSMLAYRQVYTAERAAYRNLVNMVPIPLTATHENPYREWIGAQIRADPWGYSVPGRPQRAAELAFKDARISHVKNGIYGAMMVAAMISSAFALKDPQEIIEIGLSVIPSKSRLHVAVEQVLKWSKESGDWRECWRLMNDRYGRYSGVHTINNALNVVMGLLYGAGEFTNTIAIAVMGGWDTDCNGATAGSILGATIGASSIPEGWKAPLCDSVGSCVRGYERCAISELANRTYRLASSGRC